MHSEAGDSHRHQHPQAQQSGRRRPPPLACLGGGEDEEGEHKPRCELHAHPCRQRHRPAPPPWSGAGGERQGERQGAQHQRVVVRSPYSHHQQHRVEPHEGRRPAARVPEPLGRPRNQCDGPQARQHSNHLQRPQAARHPQWGHRVAGQREQGAIGGVLEGPADERIGGVGEDLGGHMGVGVEAMQRPHAREGQVAEHVLGEQRRPQQERQVRRHHRSRQRSHRQRAGRHQHEQVAPAHGQHQRLK